MPFTSKGSAVIFLRNYDPNIVEDDIPDYFVDAATEEINERSDTQWEIDTADQTFIIDGTGNRFIHVPTIPIISLTELVIINSDETEESLIVSGTNREIRFNKETGSIERFTLFEDAIEKGLDTSDIRATIFPVGNANIRIVGKFGRNEVSNTLRLLANLIILRIMSKLNPGKFRAANLKSERIGKYAYTLDSGVSGGRTGNLTVDGYIDYLFEILPKDDALYIEAI